MICCTECFSDLEIKAAIESNGHKGNCPVCGANNVWLYDSEKDTGSSEFEELIYSIVEIYKCEDELDDTFPEEDKKALEEHLIQDWNIFAVSLEGVREIVSGIIENTIGADRRLLVQRTGIPELYDEIYLNENSIMGKYSWEDFRRYLRNENRFHSKYLNLNVLEEILRNTADTLKSGTVFYRGRISDKKGYARKEMGAPPSDKALPGRANSKGIACLYLANKKETTVKEIRANAFDYVTIGAFELKRDIKIVDLSVISHTSPFYASTDKIKYLINAKHLKNMENDLAKPVSSRDSDLDYLPTQYISDFAKYLGYDGVKYISTFDKESYNLALFDTGICNCIDCKNYLIGDLAYTLHHV